MIGGSFPENRFREDGEPKFLSGSGGGAAMELVVDTARRDAEQACGFRLVSPVSGQRFPDHERLGIPEGVEQLPAMIPQVDDRGGLERFSHLTRLLTALLRFTGCRELLPDLRRKMPK